MAAVALRTGISPAAADQAVAGLASVVTEQLVSGGRVALPGFATFETIQRAAGGCTPCGAVRGTPTTHMVPTGRAGP